MKIIIEGERPKEILKGQERECPTVPPPTEKWRAVKYC